MLGFIPRARNQVGHSAMVRPAARISRLFCQILAPVLLDLEHKVNWIMSTLEDIQAGLVAADAKISAIAADTASLLAKIETFPAPGLTPEQQAAIDDIASHVQAMNDSLAAVDASVTP